MAKIRAEATKAKPPNALVKFGFGVTRARDSHDLARYVMNGLGFSDDAVRRAVDRLPTDAEAVKALSPPEEDSD